MAPLYNVSACSISAGTQIAPFEFNFTVTKTETSKLGNFIWLFSNGSKTTGWNYS